MSMFGSLLEQPETAQFETQRQQTILIIDDDEPLVELLARRLEQQGFETLVADSGASGMALAQSERPALILLDLRLPDADGFAVCGQLADSSATCGIPVIILSGLGDPDVLRRCRSAGGRYFVRKPYDPNALLLLIRQAMLEAAGFDAAE